MDAVAERSVLRPALADNKGQAGAPVPRVQRTNSPGVDFAGYFFFAVLASFFGFLVSFFCALLPLAMVSS
jgi:hypothetical protein